VPRELTEEAVLLIQAAYVDHSRAANNLPPQRGRVLNPGSRLGVHDALAVSRQACILRVVSIVEAYLDMLSSDMFRERVPPRHELVRLLVESVEVRSSMTWDERKKAFLNFHKFGLGELDGWEVVDCAVQARNAVAHGLGRLTPQQRTGAAPGKLRKIGITLRGYQLVVPEPGVVACRDGCVRFLRAVDDRTR
jgi:hypothetical protein